MQNNQKKTKLSLAGRLRILISAFLVFLFSGVIAANFISVGYSAPSTTLLDGALGASSGDDKWTKNSESSISGSVDGNAAGTCSSASSNSSTLTLTNKLTVSASLSFDYSITKNNGSVTIDGNTVTTNGTFGEKELAAGGSVAIKITSGNGTGKVTSIEIKNIQLVNENSVSITFLAPTNGSYTVDGEEISSSVTKNSVGNTQYTLEATPNSGYKFIQWEKVVNGNTSILSKEQNSSITISESCSIRPVFAFENAAQFMNNGSYFYDLQDAINSANSSSDKKIVVTGDGSVSAGTYTIASDCTLLVPFDEAGTMYKVPSKNDYSSSYIKSSLFRKLTLEEGVVLTIHGILAVESQLSASMGNNGCPTGPYGEIQINQGASVEINSGATLYAWGYIIGDGIVNAKSGSTIYESFQIKNYRGGSATNSLNNNSNGVFLFNQYYVQNIECELCLETGATEICSSAVSVSIIGIQNTSVSFIGDSSTDSLFKMTSGKLSKKLDTSTNRLQVVIDGASVISNITVSMSVTVESYKYDLPIGHNMDIIISGNSSVTTNQNLCFLPNSSLTIEVDGVFTISSSNEVIIYDSDQWDAQYDYSAIKYPYCATTNKASFSSTDYTDSVIDVNGTIVVENEGHLYTTESGSCIKSSKKTGVVEWQCTTAIPESTTYQCTQSGTSISYISIPTTSAKLQNGDGSYYQTADKTSCSIIYSSVSDSWKDSSITTDTITLKFIDQNGNELMTSSFENPGSFTFPTKDSSWSFNVYFWQYSEGTLYTPGDTSPLSLSPDSNGNYIFTARSSGWVTETSTNNSYYLSDDFGSDSIYPGCVKGLYSVVHKDLKQQKICYFNENGLFQKSFEGVIYYSTETYSRGDNCYYYLKNGVVVENAGLQRIADPIAGTVKYYYFGNDNRAYTNGTYYISINLNGYLCPGTYEFNSDGSIVAAVKVNTKSAIKLSDDGTYCHIDGVKVGYGLFSYNGHYYYAQSDGTLVKDKTVYVSKNYSSISITGFTFPGLYYFDSNGYLCDSSLTPVEVS